MPAVLSEGVIILLSEVSAQIDKGTAICEEATGTSNTLNSRVMRQIRIVRIILFVHNDHWYRKYCPVFKREEKDTSKMSLI